MRWDGPAGFATAARCKEQLDYPRRLAEGLPIGSGQVEGACKHLIGVREKGPGMRWSAVGAQAVAAVRVLLFNQQWDTYDLAA